jgi:predicted small secreted protein
MTHKALPFILLAIGTLSLAGCNRDGERAQDHFDAAGHSISNAANETGQALSDGVHATGQAIGEGAQRTGNAINNAVNGH